MTILSEPDTITMAMGSIGLPEASAQLEDGKVDDNSLWSLTLNEIELKSGKTFGSMNMDEFLSNLWNTNAEDTTQVLQQQPNPDNNHHNTPTNNPFDDKSSQQQTHQQQQQQQQSSLISIPSPLCKKTVDEVWSDIQREQHHHHHFSSHLKPADSTNVIPHGRQQSLGNMTLEEFLVQAGVVQEAAAKLPPPRSSTNSASPSSSSSTVVLHQLKLETPSSLGSSFHGLNGNFSSVTGCFGSYHMMMNPSKGYVGEASSSDQFSRIIDGPPEVLVERRQRRMIKNRESAARSRARKQAYTMELELELNYLKEDNSRLKQIVQEIEEKAREKEYRFLVCTMSYVIPNSNNFVIAPASQLAASQRASFALTAKNWSCKL
ncbi:unnamed protein product [Linum tenue]|uniref:BZIP domain-containing protein n=1 Tax=Linum tenue TaxID=586396 RepID=A0AAV0IN64_9ROSI|nr:unnamed protein product [Linum tenue]